MNARLVRAVTAVVACAAMFAAAACSDDDDGGATSTTAPPPSSSTSTTAAGPEPVSLDLVGLTAEQIGEAESPTAMAYQSGSLTLFVAERAGVIRRITVTEDGEGEDSTREYEVEEKPLLDISDMVVSDGERGLLGIAFSPDGRRLYVSYNDVDNGDSVLDEYTMEETRPDEVIDDSRRELLRVDQPDFGNHKGGNIAFGPDGFLYWGLGDGGSQGDPSGNGQNTDVLLAKVLRIDPEGGELDDDGERVEGGAAYGIPDDNPFEDGGGKPEVFLYGVRNPWRFSFDRETGDLWIADVGGSRFEEVDRLLASEGGGAGANLGWAEMEASHELNGPNPEGALLPIFEYGQDEGGCAITGGYVYRGATIPALRGAYLYADYCQPSIRGLRVDDDEVVGRRTWDTNLESVVSFGEDVEGELYVLSLDGGIYKIVPA